MPAVAAQGDYINTGHLCDNTSTIAEGSPNVRVNGRAVAFQGAAIAPHTIESQRGVAPPGPPTNPLSVYPIQQLLGEGSSTVRVNGKAIARYGDAADEGLITDGSPNVNAN